ncbi:DUF7847 domain-containing protein [Halorussus salinisoli]|uniref:DUF7847 domain-containing protein n=1 Tax=Halorussus salinisoli TaxID=2558242 RepID=UPI0010C1F97E|nr:hypothetical protein [Halorussus salinisoli]
MGVVSSLSVAVEMLKRNPVLFVAGLVVALVNGVAAGGQMLSSGMTSVVWSFGSFAIQLGSLFFVAGAYGMAAEAIDGTTRLETFLSEGKDNFADALAATLLLVVAMVAAFVVVAVVAMVAVVAVLAGGSGTGFSTEIFVLAMTGIYLLALLPLFFLQFYLPAVVVSDRTPADALKQSYRLVRHNLLSTLGFDAVVAAVMVVGSLPTIWLYTEFTDSMAMGAATPTMYPYADLSPTVVGTYLAATVVLGTVTGTFFYAYQVAFYEEFLPENTDDAV